MRTLDVRIDAEPTRKRLEILQTQYKLSQVEIGRRTGMANVHIGRIINGKTKTVYTSKARKIFKLYNYVVTRKEMRYHWDPNMVPAHLSRLAARGLMAQGYSRIWIREQTGFDLNTLWRITMDEDQPKARHFVKKSTEEALLELVRQAGSTFGGNNITRSKALNRGWKPTMYYDELV